MAAAQITKKPSAAATTTASSSPHFSRPSSTYEQSPQQLLSPSQSTPSSSATPHSLISHSQYPQQSPESPSLLPGENKHPLPSHKQSHSLISSQRSAGAHTLMATSGLREDPLGSRGTTYTAGGSRNFSDQASVARQKSQEPYRPGQGN